MRLLYGLVRRCWLLVASISTTSLAVTQTQGRDIYRFCAVCHGDNGEGKADLGAPRLAGMERWYVEEQLAKFKQGLRGTHPQDVAGMRMRPMAKFLKNSAEIKAVSAYVAELKTTKRSVATLTGSWVKGEVHYKMCVACHGADGRGNTQLKAPSLVNKSDWYLLTQLRNYKAGIRGGDPAKDPVASSMRPITTTLDQQAMIDVVVYIQGLQ